MTVALLNLWLESARQGYRNRQTFARKIERFWLK
jgi:hypothetical protein